MGFSKTFFFYLDCAADDFLSQFRKNDIVQNNFLHRWERLHQSWEFIFVKSAFTVPHEVCNFNVMRYEAFKVQRKGLLFYRSY